MKSAFLALATGLAFVALSSAAFADGEGCDWKKKRDGNKGVSTEAWQQFKKDHGWYSKKDHRGFGEAYKEHMKKHGEKTSSGVEI